MFAHDVADAQGLVSQIKSIRNAEKVQQCSFVALID
jgi:hypothetical protein